MKKSYAFIDRYTLPFVMAYVSLFIAALAIIY